MKPRLALAFLAASVAMGYGVYNVKYQVRVLKEEAQSLRAEIRRERETLNVLKAEWAYLNRPGRLDTLAKRHLDLQVLKSAQVATMPQFDAAMPKLAETEPQGDAALASMKE